MEQRDDPSATTVTILGHLVGAKSLAHVVPHVIHVRLLDNVVLHKHGLHLHLPLSNTAKQKKRDGMNEQSRMQNRRLNSELPRT